MMTVTAISTGAIVMIAAVSHEVNRVWCEYNGDTSQKPWAEAADWQKDSAILGVNFHLANPDAGDSASHDSWMEHKLANGWVYGETKDETAKTHPCLLPFDQLPAEQQFKDRLFRTIVHGAADNMPADSAAPTDQPMLELLTGTVGDLVDALPAATLPDVLLLLDVESRSKGRKTAIAAMAEALTREDGWQLAPGVTVRILDQVDHDKLIAERDQLASALDGAGADIAAAQAMLPRKARAIGPVEGAADGAALADLIGGTVQIVLSDGEQEIVAIDPYTISGSGAWVRRGSGFMLRNHLTVKGPVFGAAAYPVAGFGLIGADGEQIGWCALPNLVPVGGGQEVQFRDSVLFG